MSVRFPQQPPDRVSLGFKRPKTRSSGDTNKLNTPQDIAEFQRNGVRDDWMMGLKTVFGYVAVVVVIVLAIYAAKTL